ncbi:MULTISPECIES: type II toxin-antitoxin system VapC family toxin [unclassified Moraxella]|uniref:type II toxin-antitoxin system VapC family toxin n=1 Tax=unclassified Moraxella TaxID=2685852 RepID=UPI003AF7C893
MYLLDTNAVSEIRKISQGKANQGFNNWFKTISISDLYVNTVVLMELEKWYLLKARKDKVQADILENWVLNKVYPMFDNRILIIDTAVAKVCAKLFVPNPKPENDAWIGATAIAHDLIVVTRNVDDFAEMPVKLLNPFN